MVYYTMTSAWNAIRSTYASKDWCKVVWFNKHVPRWAFILWLAMQDKLNTLDRLLVWGVVNEANCVLCSIGNIEDHNHLFFDCSYSTAVRLDILMKNHVNRAPLVWND